MAEIHPSATVGKGVELADGVVVGPNCVIESGVRIGTDTKLTANVVIGKDTVIGKNNQLFPNCAVGTQPQILLSDENEKYGKLVIGDSNIIREQATIHPSMYPEKVTTIGNDNFIMIGVHIGHDCVLGDKIVLSNYVQISGHCKIGTGSWLSGVVLLHQFVTIGKWCYAAGMAGVNHDVPPFLIVSGHYPPEIRGVNRRGLARAGLDEQQQKEILSAYKKLYRNGQPLLENAENLAKEKDLDKNVRAIVDAIIKSGQHRFGRYLEQFRPDR